MNRKRTDKLKTILEIPENAAGNYVIGTYEVPGAWLAALKVTPRARTYDTKYTEENIYGIRIYNISFIVWGRWLGQGQSGVE